MRVFIAALVVALFAMPARADTTTSLANVLALEQLVDGLQTTSLTHERRCAIALDRGQLVDACWSPLTEYDPIVKPLAKSLSEMIGVGTIVNIGARIVGRRNVVARYALGAAVVAYPLLLEHNVRAMHVSATVHF